MSREKFPRRDERPAGRDIQVLSKFERRVEKVGKIMLDAGVTPETARKLEKILFDTAVELRDIANQIRNSDRLLVYHPPYFRISEVNDEEFAVRCLDGTGFLDFFEEEQLQSMTPEQIISGIELVSEYELKNARRIKELMAPDKS